MAEPWPLRTSTRSRRLQHSSLGGSRRDHRLVRRVPCPPLYRLATGGAKKHLPVAPRRGAEAPPSRGNGFAIENRSGPANCAQIPNMLGPANTIAVIVVTANRVRTLNVSDRHQSAIPHILPRRSPAKAQPRRRIPGRGCQTEEPSCTPTSWLACNDALLVDAESSLVDLVPV